MAIRRFSISIMAIHISVQLLVLILGAPARSSGAAKPIDRTFDCESASLKQLEAYISEEHFWEGNELPARKLRVVLFVSSSGHNGGDDACEVLAIVPDLNATYKFRFCGAGSIPEGGWTEWAGVPPQEFAPDKYLANELARFPDIVAHAKRTENVLEISSDPATLFRLDPTVKARRISQIEQAADAAFHQRPLEIRIANFSAYTHQINVFIPAAKQMVTFSVIGKCTGEATVSIGRELSLGSIRDDLRKRIEGNSVISVIR